jgi:DNA-3-methyladenine glycosylase
MRRRRLRRAFFERNALVVAPDLLGKLLRRRRPTGLQTGRIVEVEAYLGPDDQASHARRGPTPRAKIMFGPPGRAYVYMIYGMYHGMNVVCSPEGEASAVLIRALEPVSGIALPTDGPGKLCKALDIDRSLNGEDLVRGDAIWLEDDGAAAPPHVTSPRIGVAYAGEWARRPYRFSVIGSEHVSRPKPPGHSPRRSPGNGCPGTADPPS